MPDRLTESNAIKISFYLFCQIFKKLILLQMNRLNEIDPLSHKFFNPETQADPVKCFVEKKKLSSQNQIDQMSWFSWTRLKGGTKSRSFGCVYWRQKLVSD